MSWTTWWAPSNRTFDLDLAELDRFGYQDKAHLFEPILDAAEETGLLRRLGRRVQLTPKGFKQASPEAHGRTGRDLGHPHRACGFVTWPFTTRLEAPPP
ncbi:hypothetical protein AB0M41_30615 [Streptomyces sp. NPDC051896]|uniref:hypothetical protein n=1 Tax=Streptomyces sp. NPDC051896 TaxID=3155416 RepID=UPI003422CF8F